MKRIYDTVFDRTLSSEEEKTNTRRIKTINTHTCTGFNGIISYVFRLQKKRRRRPIPKTVPLSARTGLPAFRPESTRTTSAASAVAPPRAYIVIIVLKTNEYLTHADNHYYRNQSRWKTFRKSKKIHWQHALFFIYENLPPDNLWRWRTNTNAEWDGRLNIPDETLIFSDKTAVAKYVDIVVFNVIYWKTSRFSIVCRSCTPIRRNINAQTRILVDCTLATTTFIHDALYKQRDLQATYRIYRFYFFQTVFSTFTNCIIAEKCEKLHRKNVIIKSVFTGIGFITLWQ